jgi:hypothetical protein
MFASQFYDFYRFHLQFRCCFSRLIRRFRETRASKTPSFCVKVNKATRRPGIDEQLRSPDKGIQKQLFKLESKPDGFAKSTVVMQMGQNEVEHSAHN